MRQEQSCSSNRKLSHVLSWLTLNLIVPLRVAVECCATCLPMLGNSHTPAGALLWHCRPSACASDCRNLAASCTRLPYCRRRRRRACDAAATDKEATWSVDGNMSWAVMRGAPSARTQFFKLECSCSVVKNEPFLNCVCDCWPVTQHVIFHF